MLSPTQPPGADRVHTANAATLSPRGAGMIAFLVGQRLLRMLLTERQMPVIRILVRTYRCRARLVGIHA
jgi:hypothetical protein